MTLLDMPKGVVGDKSTKLLNPFIAGTDTTITVADVTVVPSATTSAPNYASVRMPNKSCLVTFSYTGVNTASNQLTGITIIEGDSTLALTTTYPVGSKLYWSITKKLLDNIIDNVTSGGGGGGTGDYEQLSNKPCINNVTLTGNKTSANLGLQDTLVSGTSIKTINNQSVLGSGNITVGGSSVWGQITGTLSNQTDLQTALNGKVDTVSGKGLSTNDYTDTDKGIVDNVTSALADKVDKVSGKGLSTNDYTTAEKTKLATIEDSAEVNIIETVKVNGTTQSVTLKTVDITVPTKTSDITNDSDYQTGTNVDTKISTHNSSSSAHSDIRTAITDHTGNTSNPHSVTKSQVGLGNCDNTSDVNKPISTATQTALDLKLGTVYSSAEDGYIAKVDSSDHKLKVMAAGTTSVAFADITGSPSDNTNLNTALNSKQDTLVSGTNIKSINNVSILGSGNSTSEDLGIVINLTKAQYDALSSSEKNSGKIFCTTDEVGTMSYTDLDDKPSINSVTLSGNKTLFDLGITTAIDNKVRSGTSEPSGTANVGDIYVKYTVST